MKKKMKIAVLTSGILPIPAVQGGAVENLIDYYLEYNDIHKLHDITVFSVYNKKVRKQSALKSEVNHYKYVNTQSLLFKIGAKIFAKRQRKQFYYYYQIEYFLELIIKKMKKSHFDLIILENRPGYAIRLAEEFKTPIISHIHTNLLHIPSEENLKVMSVTKGFISVSEYIKNEIKKIGIKKEIRVVYNGLDADIFNRKNIIPISRAELGFKENDFIVIFWGRLVPDKGIKELILAIQQLKDYEDIKLLVIGGINYADSENDTNVFHKELKEIAQELDNRVKFTGFIPYKEIPRYLSIANVSAIPSHINEAFGMTCIEACAMGLPVIATNDGGIPETLIGQKHLLLDKSHDLQKQIAEAIIEIKNNYHDYLGNYLNTSFTKESFGISFFSSIMQI